MLMNRRANIARHPVKKSAYFKFLSLISGPNAEWWVFLQGQWAREGKKSTTRRHGKHSSKISKNDFDDYAGPVIAQREIGKLRMKKGNVDRYIADFERLARRACYNVDDPDPGNLYSCSREDCRLPWLRAVSNTKNLKRSSSGPKPRNGSRRNGL